MVCVILICDIMPMFLLLSGLKIHVPEKSGRFAAKAVRPTRQINNTAIALFISSPYRSLVQKHVKSRQKSGDNQIVEAVPGYRVKRFFWDVWRSFSLGQDTSQDGWIRAAAEATLIAG